MKRSKISLVIIASLILNIALIFQPIGVRMTDAAFIGYVGKIIFISAQDIYSINTDGSGLVNITNTPNIEKHDPEWSPDGQKIAYRSIIDGQHDIYVINSDGSGQMQLTTDSAQDIHPAWSPDGSKLAYANKASGTFELWLMNADGSNKQKLTDNAVDDVFPTWSPDGLKLVWSSRVDYPNWRLAVASVNNVSDVEYLTPGGASTSNHADWSPDGSRISFYSSNGGNVDMYAMQPDGSDWVRLTTNSAIDVGGYHAPDGSNNMVFQSMRTGVYQLYTLNIETGEETQITDMDGGTLEYSSWQPIPNTAPVLATKSLELQSGNSKSIDVLHGATDEEALSTSNITITAQPSNGTASIESGKIKYEPNNNYVGADELTYQICDSFMLDQKCSTAALSITVKPTAAIAKVGDKIVENGVEKVVAKTNRPTFSGTATPGSTVKVEIHSDPIILTTTADSNGNWSVTPDQDLPPGDHTVKITATLNGASTELDSFVLAVQQTIPNTGASFWLTRIGGGVLLISGLSLIYWQRKRMRELFMHQVPQLFP